MHQGQCRVRNGLFLGAPRREGIGRKEEGEQA